MEVISYDEVPSFSVKILSKKCPVWLGSKVEGMMT